MVAKLPSLLTYWDISHSKLLKQRKRLDLNYVFGVFENALVYSESEQLHYKTNVLLYYHFNPS